MKHSSRVLGWTLWTNFIFATVPVVSAQDTAVTSGPVASSTSVPAAESSTSTLVNTSTSAALASTTAAPQDTSPAAARFNEQALGILLAALLCSIALGVLAVVLGCMVRQDRKRADRATLTLTPLTVGGRPSSRLLHRMSTAESGPFELQATPFDRQYSVLHENDSAVAGLDYSKRARSSSVYSSISAMPAPLQIQHALPSSAHAHSRSIDAVSASDYSDAPSLPRHSSSLPLVPPRSPRRLEPEHSNYFHPMSRQEDNALSERQKDRRVRRQGRTGDVNIAARYEPD